VDRPILPGATLIFSGARWRVLSVDTVLRVVELTAAEAGKPPVFPGTGGEIADEVRRRMFQLYRSRDVPRYLDGTAQTLLAEGRAAFHAYGHATRRIFAHDTETLLFPWRGDRIMNTLTAVLGTYGSARTAWRSRSATARRPSCSTRSPISPPVRLPTRSPQRPRCEPSSTTSTIVISASRSSTSDTRHEP